jgi:hypothetical protein
MRVLSVALFCFFAILPVSIIQSAEVQTPPFDNQAPINVAVQDALIWTGHYEGLADGIIGKRTIAAIIAFQRDQRWAPTGELSPEQIPILFKAAESYRQLNGFRMVDDGRTAISAPMPLALVRWKSATPHGSRYSSPNGEIDIILTRYRPDEASLQDLFQDVLNSATMKTIALQVLQSDAFFVSGENDSQDLYFTARAEGRSVRGLRITTPRTQRPQLARVIVAMASAFHYGMVNYAALIPSRPPEPRLFMTRDQLLPIVTASMAKAGIQNFKILPPNRDNDEVIEWVYEDGTTGELQAFRAGSGKSLTEIANWAIQSSASSCKGQFVGMRPQSRYFQGSEIQNVETRCRTNDGFLMASHSVIEVPNGEILIFSNWTKADAQSGTGTFENSQRAEKLENAAIKSRAF